MLTVGAQKLCAALRTIESIFVWTCKQCKRVGICSLETHEEAALSAAGDLLRFATQNTAEVPLDVVKSITDAFGPKQANTWTDAVAVNFWVAYTSAAT